MRSVAAPSCQRFWDSRREKASLLSDERLVSSMLVCPRTPTQQGAVKDVCDASSVLICKIIMACHE
ncbi:hypothetical protein E2C01_055107 [Portunus trituberculatus]|uniref:Uncharacterized protein n=1 Tax=Portunus trituberculatus TaxID=210409 RepID=A0A5B7GWQ8_PORTR|nr:hypothetical protein [Portunus trituberculatus]